MNKTIEQTLLQPEGKQLEFKRDLSSPKPIMKSLTAFANTAGGTLIIGITDSGELNKQVKRLLTKELIERTIPDKPSSRLQKYKLTQKGYNLIAEISNIFKENL